MTNDTSPDWSNLQRMPLRTLKLEYDHFQISGSPYRASVLKAELDRRARPEQVPEREIGDSDTQSHAP